MAIFHKDHKQTEVQDDWQLVWNSSYVCAKFAHTYNEKFKLLFTYVNAAVKTIVIQQNNLISVKTRSKEEQRSRSSLQWDQ